MLYQNIIALKNWEMAPRVKLLLCKCETLSPILSTHVVTGVLVCECNPNAPTVNWRGGRDAHTQF